MAVEITLALLVSLIGLGISSMSFIIARNNDSKKLEARLTRLETKIEPFWMFINKELPNLIIQETTPELDNLLCARQSGEAIKRSERIQLMHLLEEEYFKAKLVEDTGRAHAIRLLLIKMECEENGI